MITEIKARQFTVFNTPVRSVRHEGDLWTLRELHDAVQSEQWHENIAPIRNLAPYKREKDESGKRKSDRALKYSQLKESTLPYAVVSGTWNPHRRHADGATHHQRPCSVNGLLSASALRLLDLDDLDSSDRQVIMGALRDGVVPRAAACWLSPGGDGLHLIAALDPAPVCQKDSHIAFAVLVEDLDLRLSVASVESDPAAKNLMRPSFVSCDPDAWLADSPQPLRWQDIPGDAHAGRNRRTENGHNKDDRGARNSLLVQMERVARRVVATGLDYSAWFGLMGALKSAGMDMEMVESISREGGDRYVPGEIERKWGDLLPSDNPAKVINGMARNRGVRERVVDGTRSANRSRKDTPPAPDGTPPEEFVPPRWLEIGQWVARLLLYPDFVYDRATDAYWHWTDGQRWTLLSARSPLMIDALNAEQFKLAQRLREHGSGDAAGMVARVRQWQTQLNMQWSPLNTGIRSVLSRDLQLPPDHLIACANGVLDLRDGLLHPHSPLGPHLITAVTHGQYLPDRLDALRVIIDRRLEPALPDPKRRAYLYKTLTIMLGGKGGGGERGSLLYLTGTSGGGKGNTANVLRIAAGDYAMTGNADALFAKGGINDSLANLLERSPRIILFHEAERLPMQKILSLTGRDEMSARGPIGRPSAALSEQASLLLPSTSHKGGWTAGRNAGSRRYGSLAAPRTASSPPRDATTRPLMRATRSLPSCCTMPSGCGQTHRRGRHCRTRQATGTPSPPPQMPTW